MSAIADTRLLARALAGSSGLVARLFAREVDGQLLEVLRELSRTGAFPLRGLDVDARGAEATEVELERLATEYCRLFLGPGECCVPYGSIRMGEATLGGRMGELILRFAGEAGLRVEPAPPIVSADHVAVVFALLARLYEMAESTGDARAAQAFLRECVNPWVPEFLRALRAMSPDTIYGSAAELSERVLADALTSAPH